MPRRQGVEQLDRAPIRNAQAVDAHERGHDVMGIYTVTQSQGMSHFVQSNGPHSAGVERMTVADMSGKGDLATDQPAISIGPPCRRPGLVVEMVGPLHANVGLAR